MRWRPFGFIVGQSWPRVAERFPPFLSSQKSSICIFCRAQSLDLGDDNDDSSASSPGFSENDLQRWEKMYYEAEEQKGPTTAAAVPGGSTDVIDGGTAPATASAVRVISFDLDNTLWKTSATIDAANHALAAYLDQQHGIVPSKRVEVVMGDLFGRNKLRYCPPMEGSTAKAPVLLTLLRKDALRWVLEEHQHQNEENDNNILDDVETVVDKAFNVWVAARHEAIVSHMAEDVVETLQNLSSSSHPIRIGAITDGNSNPHLVQDLSKFFDFCVNAEQVGIAKPDKRVYLKAAREVIVAFNGDDSASVSEDELEDRIGPWWVHVGDDFVKDIVAAKSLGMRTVWVKELIKGKVQKVDSTSLATSSSSQRTVQDLVKDVSESGQVVKMDVGAEDYLAQTLQDEFADAVVDKFSDLANIIREWQQEAAAETIEASGAHGEVGLTIKEDITTSKSQPTSPDALLAVKSSKFCMFCGEAILVQARFCSSCGESQGGT